MFANMKKTLCFMLILLLALSNIAVVSAAQDVSEPEIKIVLNGSALELLVPPFIQDGTTYAAMREVAEFLGKTVDWDGDSATAYIYGEGENMGDVFTDKLPNGEIRVCLDGAVVELKDANGGKVMPWVKDGRTVMPIRGLSELLGLEVDWDGETRTVILSKADVEDVEDEKDAANTKDIDDTEDIPTKPASNNGSAAMVVYEDLDNGFTISYPADWNVLSVPPAVFTIGSPSGDASANIIANLGTSSLDLITKKALQEQFTELGLDAKVISVTDVKIAGYPAKKIITHLVVLGTTAVTEQYALNRNDRSYVITFGYISSGTDYSKTIADILASFKFLD